MKEPLDVVEGQLVLIEPSERTRQALHKKMFWEKGRVKQLLPSRDKKFRLVRVERFNLDGTTTLLECPIQRLYPLEELPDVDQVRLRLVDEPGEEKESSVTQLTRVFEKLSFPPLVQNSPSRVMRLA